MEQNGTFSFVLFCFDLFFFVLFFFVFGFVFVFVFVFDTSVNCNVMFAHIMTFYCISVFNLL